jgi:hypothetical protein
LYELQALELNLLVAMVHVLQLVLMECLHRVVLKHMNTVAVLSALDSYMDIQVCLIQARQLDI